MHSRGSLMASVQTGHQFKFSLKSGETNVSSQVWYHIMHNDWSYNNMLLKFMNISCCLCDVRHLKVWKKKKKKIIFYFPAVTLTGSAAGDAALDKFNKSWTELDDWLALLDHMVQTQRVMVGDLDEINDMTVKLKVRLCLHLAAFILSPQ